MKARYITPKTSEVSIACSNILVASEDNFICSDGCKHWHFCQDRRIGKDCPDKEYQNMEANELMIGDWVLLADGPARVISIAQDGIYFEDKFGKGACPFDKIRPIPLTVEILEKNGFEKISLKSGRVVYSLADDYYDLEAEEITDSIWRIEYFNVEASFPSCRDLVGFVHEIQHFLNSHIIEKEIEL